MDFEAQRAQMVRKQLRGRGITNERVLAAMDEVPREEFVESHDRRWAYSDGALSIGHGQTISQPWIVAAICQSLSPQPDDDALEIGSGSGYSTAVLAQLCRSVLGFEIVPELCAVAQERLAEAANAEVVCRDGAAEPPERDFDLIAIHAATPGKPANLLEKLTEGGRLVAPVAAGLHETLTLFTRTAAGFEEEQIAQVRFVPLTGRLGR